MFGTQRFVMGLSSNALSKFHFLPRNSYDNDLTDRVMTAFGAEQIWLNVNCKDLVCAGLENNDQEGTGSTAWRQTPPSQEVGDFDLETMRRFHRYPNLASPGRLLSLRRPLVIRFSRDLSEDREERRYRNRFGQIADLLEASYISRGDLLLQDNLIDELATGSLPRDS